MKTSRILKIAAQTLVDPKRVTRTIGASGGGYARKAIMSFNDSYFPYMDYDHYMRTRFDTWDFVIVR